MKVCWIWRKYTYIIIIIIIIFIIIIPVDFSWLILDNT
jgi:hypothetical protein